jgi:mono/diheme cytochrome c family protein
MTSLLRYFAYALLSALLACVALGAYVYVSNLRLLDRRYPVAPVQIAAASGPDAAQRGKALADVTGCTDCHGADLRGKLFDDEGWLHGKYYASNLTLKAQEYSDADLARIVRLGVRPDGKSVMAMPAMGFVRVTDDEMADIIAFVRSVPAGGTAAPAHYIGPLDQWDLWRGITMKPAIAYVEVERRKQPADAGPQHEAARHLAGIVCAECHSGDLKGNGWDTGAPDLIVIGSYGLPELTRLLRTGTGVDGGQHGLMSEVAKSRLRNLSDSQIAGLHAYLSARAQHKQ